MADWDFNVYHFSGSSQTQVEITTDVISIPLFTDTGSGEVNEAQIVLNAVDGQYIQANINSKAKIEQFDRIRIKVDDALTHQGTQQGEYDKYFYVMKKQPIKSKDSGVRLQLELLGTEAFLQRVQYAKPHYFETPFDVFKSIGDQYNANRGSSSVMPTLEKHGDPTYNELPSWLINTYDFAVNEDNCFDRMGEVIDSMGASQAAGGALNFFDLKFNYYSDNGLTLRPQIFSSGNETDVDNNGVTTEVGDEDIVTIDNSTAVNVGESDGGIDAKSGTQILAWGATESGSLPTDFSKFWARQQWWNLFFPDWDNSVTYQTGAKVSYVVSGERKNYISATNNNTSTPPTNWTLQTPAIYYGDDYQYSPWTSDKAVSIWINGSADPTHSFGLNDASPGKYYFWDHNLTINDGFFWRTTADIASRSDAIGNTYGTPNQQIPQEYLYDTTGNGTGDSFYRGFRVLCYGDPVANGVDGTGANLYFGYPASSASAAVDSNGKKIANSILQYDGTKWKVFARPFEDQFSSTSDPIGLQCTLMHEASTWQFNKTGSSVWNDITDDDIGNDSFHPVIYEDNEYKITNVPGVLANYADHKQNSSVAVKDVDDTDGPYSGDPWDSTNANSAVEVVYDWAPGAVKYADNLASGRDDEDFYQVGAYISTRFPFPKTSYNSITEDVGDIYGGGTNTDNPKEPATLDTQNMHMTHDGKNGFNQSSSEDLGQLNAISFNMKLHYQQQHLVSSVLSDVFGETGANFKMRCALWDTDDNCVVQDFQIFFNDFWQGVNLPISGFQIFKAREPRYGTNAEYWFFQPKGIDVQNIFIWRNLKAISIYTLDQYDEHGRYSPKAGRYCDADTDWRRRITLTLDALRFTKPLLASTGAETGDVIQPDFLEKPEISNYEQLKSDAEAEKQKHLHQRVEYDVTTTGRFDVGFGDYFNLADDEIIPAFTNPTESAGQVKLVAKRIEYSISKPLNGKGGFLRRIRGVRRFV